MKNYDWREFTRRIPITAPAKAIYDAWATQQGLESWFLRHSTFTKKDGSLRTRTSYIEAGDTYKWLWYGYDDSVVEEKKILEANGWDRIQFLFSGDCVVTVTIRQEEGQNICALRQQMPMESEDEQRYYFIECGGGWSFYLANLKSVLEGGLDLRNKNVNLQNVITS
jgi:uncharacterized protein YndB with AHSA1/START domain